jgi:hypothetical protein
MQSTGRHNDTLPQRHASMVVAVSVMGLLILGAYSVWEYFRHHYVRFTADILGFIGFIGVIVLARRRVWTIPQLLPVAACAGVAFILMMIS